MSGIRADLRDAIASLIAAGASRGFVTFDEVADHLAHVEADPETFDAVIGALASAGIEVGEGAPLPKTRAPRGSTEADLGSPDVVAAYERDLARCVPLDPETEERVSARLGTALAQLREVYSSAPLETKTTPGIEGSQTQGGEDPALLCEWARAWERIGATSRGTMAAWIDEATLARIRSSLSAVDEARDSLVRGTMRLVFSLARHYEDRGVELLDLVQEGNAGLLRAVQRYDPRHGRPFASYATWWIRQAMARLVREQGKAFKLTPELDATIRRIHRARRRLEQALQREPTNVEIAEEAGIEEQTVDRILRVLSAPLRLDATVGDEEAPLHEFLEISVDARPPTEGISGALRAEIERVVDTLDPLEQRLIRLRHGLADGTVRTLEEVAAELGITRERARQIEGRALRKLRHPSRRQRLDPPD